MDSSTGSRWLLLGGVGSVAVAVAHASAVFIGAAAYRFMGAPDLAPMAERGSLIPALLTSGLVVLFLIWALYAFSGAGQIRRFPLLRTGNVVIGAIYTLRGLVLIPELVLLFLGKHPAPRMALFSGISLLIGLFYFVGSWQHFWVNRAARVA